MCGAFGWHCLSTLRQATNDAMKWNGCDARCEMRDARLRGRTERARRRGARRPTAGEGLSGGDGWHAAVAANGELPIRDLWQIVIS